MYYFDNTFDVIVEESLIDGRPEADYLADRIGIMIQGQLKHIGTSTDLKAAYGQGYKLTLTCPADIQTRTSIDMYPLLHLRGRCCVNIRFMMENLRDRYTKIVDGLVSLVYEVNTSTDVIARVVQEINERKTELGISDWGISPATLDDVFIRLCDGAAHEG